MIGRLELVFERRHGSTVLTHGHADAPLRVGRVHTIDDAAYVILASTGPGVFAGDALEMLVHVGAGARAVLTSQSALQVHPSPAETPARIVHRYLVDDDGELHCHWDPVIPFAGARLEQQFDVSVTTGARLYWSDALMAGRATRGESWRFADLTHTLGLDVAGVPVYLERYRLTPGDRAIGAPWSAGPHQYFSTTLVHHAGAATADAADQLHAALIGRSLVRAAVDLLQPGLIVARVAAVHGPAFNATRVALRELALATIFHSPQLVGRK